MKVGHDQTRLRRASASIVSKMDTILWGTPRDKSFKRNTNRTTSAMSTVGYEVLDPVYAYKGHSFYNVEDNMQI